MKKVLIPTKLNAVARETLNAHGSYEVVQDESTDLGTLASQNPDTYALIVRSEKVTQEIILKVMLFQAYKLTTLLAKKYFMQVLNKAVMTL